MRPFCVSVSQQRNNQKTVQITLVFNHHRFLCTPRSKTWCVQALLQPISKNAVFAWLFACPEHRQNEYNIANPLGQLTINQKRTKNTNPKLKRVHFPDLLHTGRKPWYLQDWFAPIVQNHWSLPGFLHSPNINKTHVTLQNHFNLCTLFRATASKQISITKKRHSFRFQ